MTEGLTDQLKPEDGMDMTDDAVGSPRNLQEKQKTINDLQQYIESADQRINELKQTIQDLTLNS